MIQILAKIASGLGKAAKATSKAARVTNKAARAAKKTSKTMEKTSKTMGKAELGKSGNAVFDKYAETHVVGKLFGQISKFFSKGSAALKGTSKGMRSASKGMRSASKGMRSASKKIRAAASPAETAIEKIFGEDVAEKATSVLKVAKNPKGALKRGIKDLLGDEYYNIQLNKYADFFSEELGIENNEELKQALETPGYLERFETLIEEDVEITRYRDEEIAGLEGEFSNEEIANALITQALGGNEDNSKLINLIKKSE